MGILEEITKIYPKFNDELADPRTKDWPLMKSPFPLLGIVGLYLWFCLKAGPHFMKDRQAFKLKNIIVLYNIFQVGFSLVLFYKSIEVVRHGFNFKCEPINYSNDPHALYEAVGTYWYFIAKITELLDTVFFVLRKKYSQVSTLHLYHHTLMAVLSWIYVKYYAGGQSMIPGMANSFVHIFMYSYYLLSSLGPNFQKHLWWKKQLTVLQLVQFFLMGTHSLQAMFRECNFPQWINILCFTQSVVFGRLFTNFYIQSYVRPKQLAGYTNGNIRGKAD